MEGFTKGYKIAILMLMNTDSSAIQFRSTGSNRRRASVSVGQQWALEWNDLRLAKSKHSNTDWLVFVKSQKRVGAEDDNTIEVVLENVPLLWNVKHEIHISIVEHNSEELLDERE